MTKAKITQSSRLGEAVEYTDWISADEYDTPCKRES